MPNPTLEAMVEPFLAQLRRVNTDRYHAWVGDGQDAGILFDAAELGGEVGELLNVVKKLAREEAGWRGSRASPGDFEEECGDVLICLDKLARRRGVDLEAATIAKFNATSEKVDLPHRLAASPPPVVGGEGAVLGELLAVIHRDGGQYQDAHGTAKACEDAMAICAATPAGGTLATTTPADYEGDGRRAGCPETADRPQLADGVEAAQSQYSAGYLAGKEAAAKVADQLYDTAHEASNKCSYDDLSRFCSLAGAASGAREVAKAIRAHHPGAGQSK